MGYIDLSEIDGLNDRRNLLLLTYKKVRSIDDESNITILSTFYPDFIDNHIEAIMRDLERRGLLRLVNKHPEMPDTDEYGNENDKYEWTTTESGEMALKTNLFPSEMKKRNDDENQRLNNENDRRFNRSIALWSLLVSIIAIIIAAIALFK